VRFADSTAYLAVVGAKIILKVGDRTLTRFITGGGSYLSSGDARRVFGLGKATKIDELTVVWTAQSLEGDPPKGGDRYIQVWHDLPIDRYHQLLQDRSASKGRGGDRDSGANKQFQ
jgi:hypothetical protein